MRFADGRRNDRTSTIPIVFCLFGPAMTSGKANDVAKVINGDPVVRDLLRVVFLPDYNVSLAEKITLVPFTNSDRLFFVQLYRWFSSVLKGVTIIRPETIVRWHRAGWRCSPILREPAQVAPSGCGAPPESHASRLRDEKNCSKGRNNKADLRNRAFVQRTDGAAIPDIGAAVAIGIGVENLVPNSGEWNLDPVIPIDLGREIDHHQAALARLASLAQPSENTALDVMHDQPLESDAVAVELVQRRQSPVEMVEVADQSLNACMP